MQSVSPALSLAAAVATLPLHAGVTVLPPVPDVGSPGTELEFAL